MSFVSMMRTGELPEKPWKAEAVARLFASVVICAIFAGGAVAPRDWLFELPPSTTKPLAVRFAIAIQWEHFAALIAALIIVHFAASVAI